MAQDRIQRHTDETHNTDRRGLLTPAQSPVCSPFPIARAFLIVLLPILAGACLVPAPGRPTPTGPPTAVWNPAMLADIKARVDADDPGIRPALDTLRARADAAMALPLVTVMDKPLLPPSGDRHDYLTRATYFWPNPDTPDGLPFVKRDGVVYEKSRSETDFYARNQLDRTLLTLGLAYFLTADERYATHAVRQTRAWFLDPSTRMNPHLNYAQGVPGVWEGSLWGIIDTWRWSVLVDAVRLLEPSAAWTEADREGLAAWFDAYQTWLRTSELGRDESLMWNNHGPFYDAQVAALALYAGRDSVARAVIDAARHRRIAHGIEPDGRQRYELERTRPFGYSLFSLRGYFTLAAIGDRLGFDLWHYTATDGSGIRAGLAFLAQYADTSRAWPYEDLQFDRTELIPLLRWAAYAYDDPDYLDQARRIPGYAEAVRSFPRRITDLPQLFLSP